ncbi:hypothetical protein [Gemmatimonas sp.]|uniref:hypothetical protein n=1 Tax=Gemmatimonas sp. TaxID=1962908 RepID=UPI0033428E6C
MYRTSSWRFANVALALCVTAPFAHAQNLVVNPSFEADNYANFSGFNASGAGGTFVGTNGLGFNKPGSITGWTIGESVDIYTGLPFTQVDGNSYLDIVGGGNSRTGAFFISQLLATTAGQTYSLSFNYGENVSLKSGNSVDLRVSLTSNAGTGPIDFAQAISWTLPANASTDPRWRTASFSFTATSALTELRLGDESGIPLGSVSESYTVGGAVVDNFSVVSVAAVPEPRSLTLVAMGLAMLAGLAGAKHRRRVSDATSGATAL